MPWVSILVRGLTDPQGASSLTFPGERPASCQWSVRCTRGSRRAQPDLFPVEPQFFLHGTPRPLSSTVANTDFREIHTHVLKIQ